MQAGRPDLAALIRDGAAQAMRSKNKFSTEVQAKLNSLKWRNKHRLAEFYPYTFACPPLNGVTLEITQQRQGEQRGIGTGAVVWDGAVVLMKYLEKLELESRSRSEHGKGYFASKSVIELGAGTGAVGIAAAALGAKSVAITDLDEILFLTRQNVQAAATLLDGRIPGVSLQDRVHTFSYDWGKASEDIDALAPFDTVLVAECIVPRLYPIEPLVKAIAHLAPTGSTTEVLVAYEHRHHHEFHPPERFKQLLEAEGFRLMVIPREEQDPEYNLEDIELWRIVRADAVKQRSQHSHSSASSVEHASDGHDGPIKAKTHADYVAEKVVQQQQQNRLREILTHLWPNKSAAVLKGLQKLRRCNVVSVSDLQQSLGDFCAPSHLESDAAPTPQTIPLNQNLRRLGFKTFGAASLLKLRQWFRDASRNRTESETAGTAGASKVSDQSVEEVMEACFGGSDSDDSSDDNGPTVVVSKDDLLNGGSVAAVMDACFGSETESDSDDSSDSEAGAVTMQNAGPGPSNRPATDGPLSLDDFFAREFERRVDLRSPWLKLCVVVLVEQQKSFGSIEQIISKSGPYKDSIETHHIVTKGLSEPEILQSLSHAAPTGADILMDLRSHRSAESVCVEIFNSLYNACVLPGYVYLALCMHDLGSVSR